MYPLSTVLVLVFCYALAAFADVEVTRDRASGDTTIKTKVRAAMTTPHIHLYGMFSPSTKEPPTVALLLSASAQSWRYRECHRTAWQVDNRAFALPQPSYEGKAGAGFVTEFLTIQPLALEQLGRMAQAHTIEYAICNETFTVSPEEMEDFHTFMDKAKEQMKK